MLKEEYLTVGSVATSKLVVKKSVFYGFAVPVEDELQVEEQLRQFRKKYYDARHVCYAYCLNGETAIEKSSDNGEPSGTAGRPMLGVLQSHCLTQVLLVAVRYFGGIKLGTSGLIAAYREVAELTLANAEIVTRKYMEHYSFTFGYDAMNVVMTAVKAKDVQVVSSSFDLTCRLTVTGVPSEVARLKILLEGKIENV